MLTLLALGLTSPVLATEPAAGPGGGPACLRLRVVADPRTVDARFLLDEGKATRIEAVVAEMWPETIHPSEIGSESLAGRVRDAREALLGVLSLDELL